ncbi:MAG: MFS transporter [Pseudomonadota bacterium]
MALKLLKKRPILGWVLYDCANSAFALSVVATLYPVFLSNYWSEGTDASLVTARLGLTTAAASLIIAFVAPVLGAIADAGGARKRFQIVFTGLALTSTGSLYFVGQGQWQAALGLYLIALVGFYGANTFYDSLIVNVAKPDEFEQVSALGFSMGYGASVLLFLFNLWMVQSPETFGLANAAVATQIAFALVAVWWLVFTIPLVLFVKEQKNEGPSLGRAIVDGYRTLIKTFREVRKYKNLGLFLLAYWLYIDGVHTLFLMATNFGLRLGFEQNDLMLALLITNIIGVPATLGFGWLGDRIGPKRAIYMGVSVYLLIGLWGLVLEEVWQYYAMAIGVGLVQGGVQAMSRSLYARLVPPEKASEFFGFYSMLGKFAAILGPLLIGLLALVSDDPRVSVLALIPLFVLGLMVLTRVDVSDVKPAR